MSYSNMDFLPQHIAIIMDGNGKWARQRGLPRLAGHREGAANAHRVVEILADYGIKYLTLYVFSTENWNRPKEEIDGIFQILEERFDEEIEFAQKRGIRIYHVGDLNGLPPQIKGKLKQAVESTKNNTVMNVGLAFNYGGRGEIIEAVRCLIRSNAPVEDVNEASLARHLHTAGLPDPDLVIRTGGEMRLSNFLLWQAAYAEFYFTEVLWPEFNRDEIDKALKAYGERQRRFGSVESPE